MTQLELIREWQEKEDLLRQAAEECMELGHAFLKLDRVLRGKNPTPVTAEDAWDQVLEEIADLSNALLALELDNSLVRMQVARIMAEKQARWAERLKKDRAKSVPDLGTKEMMG